MTELISFKTIMKSTILSCFFSKFHFMNLLFSFRSRRWLYTFWVIEIFRKYLEESHRTQHYNIMLRSYKNYIVESSFQAGNPIIIIYVRERALVTISETFKVVKYKNSTFTTHTYVIYVSTLAIINRWQVLPLL